MSMKDIVQQYLSEVRRKPGAPALTPEASKLMTELRDMWQTHVKAPYPHQPKAPSLKDLGAKLVEIDGFIAGIVFSTLRGAPVNKKFLKVNEDFNQELVSLKPCESEPKTYQEWLTLKDLKDWLDRMMRIVIAIHKKLC